MVLDVSLRALVCTTTSTGVRWINSSALLQKRRHPILLHLHITRMNKDVIVCFAFNERMKPVLAHPGRISTLPFQTKNDRSARPRLALEKLCRLVYFLTYYLAAEHVNYLHLIIQLSWQR